MVSRICPQVLFSHRILLVVGLAGVVRGEHPRLEWDSGTRRLLVEGAVYGRMRELADGTLLAVTERQRAVVVLRSADGGRTWTEPAVVVTWEHGVPANPELCVLGDGGVLLFWNERPTVQGGPHPFTIRMARSRNGGKTWTPRGEAVFTAGNTTATACWEPAAIETDPGEVRLFFARERPGEQEIASMQSRDSGRTWAAPEQASLRPKFRDGMPVPARLASGRVVLSVEDNGLVPALFAPPFRPTIVSVGSGERWPALAADREHPSNRTNVAAPYLVALPGGTTLLAAQSNEDERPFHRMVVYVGDTAARNFTSRSLPFGLPEGSSLEWNSLCAVGRDGVIALTSGSIDGRGGVWMIRGRLASAPVDPAATPAAGEPGRPE